MLKTFAGLTLLTAIGLFVSGCASGRPPPVTLAAFNCADNIPPEWASPVPGAPLPPDRGPLPADLAGKVGQLIEERTDWQEFGLRERGQKALSDARTRDAIHIVRLCNAREAEVAKALAPRSLWQQLTPWREP